MTLYQFVVTLTKHIQEYLSTFLPKYDEPIYFARRD